MAATDQKADLQC